MRNDITILLFIAAVPLFAGSPLPARADDLEIPPRRAGQWEMTMSLGHGLPEMKTQMCLDADTDKAMMAAGLSLSKDMCTQQSVRHEGSDIVIESTCAFGGMKTTSHIVISGDFQSEYKIHIAGTIDGGPKAMSRKTDMTQIVRWLSADCSGGLKPGEMTMPGGMKIDATKVLKSMGG